MAVSAAVALVLGACKRGGAGTTATTPAPASPAATSAPPPASPSAPALTTLATAATWVDIGTQAKLKPAKPAADQFTDPSAPAVQQISAQITGLDFQGLATQAYSRTKADASHPTYGNYNVKVVVFGSAADAQAFADADAKEVINHKYSANSGVGPFKEVDSYMDGPVLEDGQGHINLMFTIGNVAVDMGVAETSPRGGRTEIWKLGDYIVANSTKV